MLFNNSSICYISLYLITYNISLYIFTTVLTYFYAEIKTLNLLHKLNNVLIFRLWAALVLFSIAGIPPFFGFFIKLTLLYYINSNTFSISLLFTIFLLINLYFYLQNIRYFMWIDSDDLKLNNWNLKFIKIANIYICIFFLFFICYGVFIYDDLILLMYNIFL